MIDNLLRDLRIGTRVLVKEKSFCALAVLVLSLGIAGVTTMFSVVNGVMLRGFSFPTSGRLVSVNFIDPKTANGGGFAGQVLSLDYQELERQQQSFEAVSGYLNGSTVNATIDGHPQRYTGAYVTDRFLHILGTSPAIGRDFTAADNTPGAPKVAIIGDAIWHRDFGAAGDIVGRPIRLNGKPATIVGVMPKGFAFPTNEEIWIPLFNEFPARPRGDQSQAAVAPSVLGLLKPGVSLDQANAEATTIARRLAAAYPDTNKRFNAGEVEPLLKTFTPLPLRGTLWTMLGFVVGVLLIACVNVMNMQFARATLRAKELAVRSSLGATRGRLIRQMLTESLLVAALGAGLGILLARESIDWLSATLRNLENAPPSWIVFDVDGKVLALTLVCTIASAVLSGLLPALMASRANATEVLRDAGRGNTSRAVSLVSRGLVVFQIVVTCILLVGSLLQLRSIMKQQTIDYGYDTAGVMSARMGLMQGDYPTDASKKLFYDRLVQQVERDPQFEAVGLTNRFRMIFANSGPLEVEGVVYREDRDRQPANWEQVTPGYFAVTGQRVLEGRNLTIQDEDARQPVAVVNAAFAAKYFGSASALGRRIRTYNLTSHQGGAWRTIVGVVSTVRMQGPFNTPGLDDSGYYVPFYANPVGPLQTAPFVSQFTTIAVKPRGGQRADALAQTLRRTVNAIDPNLPLYFIGTPKAQSEVFVSQNRIIATMFTIFGAVAIVLASVGIYGVMSFSVNQRRQEFGVRMALGAHQPRILRMVLGQGAIQVAAGLVLGMGLAYTVAMLAGSGIQNVLFGVTAKDPLTYTAVTVLISVVALVATMVPARRATRVDPMIALRAE